MIGVIWAGYLLDLIIGDPKSIPHPVVMIGKLIEKAETLLRYWLVPIIGEKVAGTILTVFIVGFTFVLTHLAIYQAALVSPWLAGLLQVLIISSALAVKGLYQAARNIFDLLIQGNTSEARVKVGWIVGRDTDRMDETEMSRATVESVAENFVDGIVSPLFYAFLGGAPLAMAYKAVNTLDSMVGYKNDQYINFGWASAKLDDLANYLPARISGYLLLVIAFLTRKNFRQAYTVLKRDAHKHPSPNGGIPEAVVAGALGIRLGGFNVYGGHKSFRAYLGDPLYPLEAKKIMETVEMVFLSSFLALIVGSSVYFIGEQLSAYLG